MPRDARILSKWRVFVDGVEIPHLGLSLTFGRNQYGAGTIMVEPDALIHDFRPNSVVTVWFYDQYGSSPLEWMPDRPTGKGATPPVASGDLDDLLNNYRLYFVGEVTGIVHSKSPQTRSMALQVSGLIRIFQRHKMFASSIGGSFTSAVVTGGYALPAMLGVENRADVLSLAALGKLYFDPSSNGISESSDDQAGVYRTSTKPDFAERMISMAAFMASFNGSLRLSTVRTRLLNTLAGFPDSTLRTLVGITLGSDVLSEAQGKVSPEWSLLDMITFFCSRVFYSWYHIPGPYTPPNKYVTVTNPETGEFMQARGQPNGVEDIKMPTEEFGVDKDEEITRKIFSIKRDFYRNDYLFLPELYFAFPPPCNFLFPEDIDGINYQRSFDNEPTRFVLVEPYFTQGAAVYVAPPWLLRNLTPDEQRTIKSPDFFTGNTAGIAGAEALGADSGKVKYNIKSPYVSPAQEQGGEGINLLSVLSDDEIEKGILTSMTYDNFELMSAVARVKELHPDNQDGDEVVDEEGGGSGGSDYTQFMNKVAMYRYQMEHVKREAQVSCTGHKWVVPGFNALICDKDAAYIGFVESVTLSVDVNSGTERMSLAMSKVRHVPYQPPAVPDNDNLQLKRKLLEAKKRDVLYIRGVYTDILGKIMDAYYDIKNGLANARTVVTGTAGSPPLTGVDIMARGVAVLNSYAMTIMNTLYGGVVTESGERFLNQRSELDSLDHTAGVNLDDVANFGSLVEYADGTHFPIFPPGWQTDKEFYNPATNSTDILYQAKVLRNRISDYVWFQIEEIKKAAAANRPLEIDDLGNQMIPQKAEDMKIDLNDATTQYEVAQAMDVVVPPSWFNQGFLRLSTIDEIYKNLIGCQPFYSVYGQSKIASGKMTDEMVYKEYIGFLQAIDKVFPILTPSGVIPSARGPDEKSEWERLSEADDLAPNPHIWMTQHIQRRDVTTMKQFLTQHKLKLVRSMSYDPTPTVFYKMVPEGMAASGSVDGYPYDNSLFSMVVDEWEMFPQGSSRLDPAIVNLRGQSRNPALTRVRRQEIVEAYSKKHFGARGFDGR